MSSDQSDQSCFEVIEFLESKESKIENTEKIKLAAFDYDGTLFRPLASDFPRHSSDYILFRKTVPEVLKKYSDDGYMVVVFSNQKKNTVASVERIKKSITEHKLAINKAYIAIGDNDFRKPSRKMFDALISNIGSKSIDSSSFYCGDAAGRKHDFADSDREFAKNCELTFKVPEDIFPVRNQLPASENKLPHVIMAVGMPGSGKSYLYSKHYSDYNLISMDVSKTKQKTITALTSALDAKKNVFIDNTNPNKDSRKVYLDVIGKYGLITDIIFMNTDAAECKRRNRSRDKKVSSVVYNIYCGKFQFPTPSEGHVTICDG